MSFADEYAVVSSQRIFGHDQNAVGQHFSELRDDIRHLVDSLSDDDALAADPTTWAQEVVERYTYTATPPRVDIAAYEFTEEERMQVDCTSWPGISYSLNEFVGRVLRPGFRFVLTVPGEGGLGLLRSRLARGGTGRKVDVEPSQIARVYEWPQARSAKEL